ncbi:MAG: helix-turn-helix transcriptional regulator [Ruminococcaceae bacterium]|nr:helix-turn-helix transcriptional regulator [Oscillospiraceae bacterium]
MHTLSDIYRPITAQPFHQSKDYCEIAPCAALRPYIRCFWGTTEPVCAQAGRSTTGLVIPDTCMDIIFDINYTRNSYNGFFCTIDEHSYRTSGAPAAETTATFAIRFYAWTALLFTERGFTGCKNQAFDIGEFFGSLKAELEPLLFDIPDLHGKIAVAEKLLLKRLCTDRISSDLLNAIYRMLQTNGRADISEICGYTAVSQRQLERIFNHSMGVSPKVFSSLLRYQMLWQDMLYSRGSTILDAVEKYGYFDQAHLLNDFKHRHLMTPKEAVRFALKR